MLRHRIDIVEAIERRAHFGEEIKRRIELYLSQLRCAGLAGQPWAIKGARAKDIRAGPCESVPVTNRPAQMLSHRFAHDHPIRIIMAKGERIACISAFKGNFLELRKIRHGIRPLRLKLRAQCAVNVTEASEAV